MRRARWHMRTSWALSAFISFHSATRCSLIPACIRRRCRRTQGVRSPDTACAASPWASAMRALRPILRACTGWCCRWTDAVESFHVQSCSLAGKRDHPTIGVARPSWISAVLGRVGHFCIDSCSVLPHCHVGTEFKKEEDLRGFRICSEPGNKKKGRALLMRGLSTLTRSYICRNSRVTSQPSVGVLGQFADRTRTVDSTVKARCVKVPGSIENWGAISVVSVPGGKRVDGRFNAVGSNFIHNAATGAKRHPCNAKQVSCPV